MPGPLQTDIKQPRAFRSSEAEVFLNVLRTSSLLVGDLVDLLKPYDITQPQYNVLRILRGAEPDGLMRGEVGERMVAREPDITRLLERMEARGLLTRARETGDRRVVRVRISATGLALVDKLDAPVEEMHRRQLQHLTVAEQHTLSELLTKARMRE